MKPGHFVLCLWMLNLALLAAAGFLVSAQKSGAEADSATARHAPAAASRIRWDALPVTQAATLPDATLSMRARPAPRPVETGEIVVETQPSDDELRAELHAALNRRYQLQRTVTWVDDGERPGAFLLCGSIKLFVFEGMNLNDLKGAEAAARGDVDVKSIAVDHVLVNAPSARKPEKRFDVRLEFGKPAPVVYRWMGSVEGGIQIAPADDTRPNPIPVQPDQPAPDKEQFTREQAEKLFNDTVAHVRVLEDGLQLTDSVPEDSELVKQGARRGDILKAINGQAVRSMGDVRRIVRTGLDAGVQEFKVDYERDGMPQSKTIKVK